jgi:hypothetical protein
VLYQVLRLTQVIIPSTLSRLYEALQPWRRARFREDSDSGRTFAFNGKHQSERPEARRSFRPAGVVTRPGARRLLRHERHREAAVDAVAAR